MSFQHTECPGRRSAAGSEIARWRRTARRPKPSLGPPGGTRWNITPPLCTPGASGLRFGLRKRRWWWRRAWSGGISRVSTHTSWASLCCRRRRSVGRACGRWWWHCKGSGDCRSAGLRIWGWWTFDVAPVQGSAWQWPSSTVEVLFFWCE